MKCARHYRALLAISVISCVLSLQTHAQAQTPAITPQVNIDQAKLLKDCPSATSARCFYSLMRVLDSGGHFWTTPFQPYDRATQTGDGYGEGIDGDIDPSMMGPRSSQRAYFNPQNPKNRFLRLNGLDSQSCFECHNTIGSYVVNKYGAMMRKPFAAGGSAGSNSNAFINPLYSRDPRVETLFIRNPPAVFGAGYTQQVADEMTHELKASRDAARRIAIKPAMQGHQVTVSLIAKGIEFGKFRTTYIGGSTAIVNGDPTLCNVNNDPAAPPGSLTPEWVGGVPGFKDDVTIKNASTNPDGIDGVSCDLVVRPFQWKGVASGLRHFVRDALDFHFSMQAFEKVGECDCDRDGKGVVVADPENVKDPLGPEIKIGQITAMASFVAMLRPPVQAELSDKAKRGRAFFFGEDGKSNCASCHFKQFELRSEQAKIEWPINPMDPHYGSIDPSKPATWAITLGQCDNKKNPPSDSCPTEFIPGGPLPAKRPGDLTEPLNLTPDEAEMYLHNPASLIDPLVASTQLAVVHREAVNEKRFKTQLDAMMQFAANRSPQGVGPLFTDAEISSVVKMLDTPLAGDAAEAQTQATQAIAASNQSVVGMDYVLPLNPSSLAVSSLQRPRLPKSETGKLFVPLMSDLKRHDMGPCLEDPSFQGASGVYSQGTDVMHILTAPREYLTRPLWGVADTGPWLHDGRALTLKDAIMMHGDSNTCKGSEANAVIDRFENLQPSQQDEVVDFLLTLRLPPPDNKGPGAVKLEKP
jgi:hypothetical protein